MEYPKALIKKFIGSPHSIWIVLLFHFIVWMAVSLVLNPHPDMVDHWVWSRFLNFGYYEHPPMVALSMRIATIIGGSHELTLKLGSVLFSLLVLYLCYKTGTLFFNKRVALIFVLILESTSYFSIGSIFWHIDQPYMAFWLIGLYTVGKFTKHKNYHWFIVLGVVLGLGAMSKYTMVLFPISLLIWCVINREARKLLFHWQVYGGAFIALLIIAPNIFWNYQHEWITFNFVLEKGLVGASFGTQFRDFIFSQPFLFSIIFFPYFWWVFFRGKVRQAMTTAPDNLDALNWSFLLVTGICPILFFSVTSFFGGNTDPHWSNVTYFSIFLLLAKYISQQIANGKLRREFRLFVGAYLLNFIAVGIVLAQVHFKIIPFSMSDGLSLNKFLGWQETAEEIETVFSKRNQQLPEYIISREYQLSSTLSFYLKNQPIPHSIEKIRRNQWSPVDAIRGKSSTLVCRPVECEKLVKSAKKRFKRDIRFMDTIKVEHMGRIIRKLYVYYLLPGNDV